MNGSGKHASIGWIKIHTIEQAIAKGHPIKIRRASQRIANIGFFDAMVNKLNAVRVQIRYCMLEIFLNGYPEFETGCTVRKQNFKSKKLACKALEKIKNSYSIGFFRDMNIT